ncbi:MAG: FAD-dependent oxidoreductase [Comamonadaceae bacterium]|nr:FAD-dependent oxidoreductase [Comamonadaceae bacterium]
MLAHDDAPWHLYAQGRRLPPDDEALALAAVEQLEQRIDAHRGPDAALSTLSDLGLWSERWASEALGPLDAGAAAASSPSKACSCTASTRPNWLVREGFGTIVASLAQGVPVALGERVREIDSRGPQIQVETTGGTVRSRDCIVTVSTGVLRAEGIRFLPGLPLDTLRALDALPMGHFAKIILEFDGPIAGLPPRAG